jgi:hypothetical protein
MIFIDLKHTISNVFNFGSCVGAIETFGTTIFVLLTSCLREPP